MASAGSSATFSLANQSLKLTSAEDIASHIKPLENSSTYTTVILTGNTLGVPASEALAPLLSSQTDLHTANLADLFTGRLLSEIPSALSTLLTALAKCPKLETVDLSDNAFGLNTVEPLVTFLRAHVPLRHLILNNNGLGPIAGTKVADALTELAARKSEARKEGKDVPDLETVVCGRNRLESESMEAWATAYKTHSAVKTVKMVQNGIRPEGIVALLRDGLSNCRDLEVLDLQDNTFTESGARALAGAAASWTLLEELSLHDAYLKSRGVSMLSEVLGKGSHKKLGTLRLQYNDMNANALAQLVGSIEAGSLGKLQRVELNGNKFSEDEPKVLRLREILDERREKAGAEEDDAAWGLDELDEMEDDSEEEEGSEPEEEDREERAERELKLADEEENMNVAQEEDKTVDGLADALGKTVM